MNRRTLTTLALTPALAATVALAGCSTSPSEDAPSTSPSASAPVVALGDDLEAQLFAAARDGDVALAAAVLDAGQSPDALSGETTALQVAITRDDLEMATLLVDAGATVADETGDLIFVAAQHASGDMVNLLLDAGSSPVAGDERGGEVLASAAYYNNADALQALIDAGAPVDAVFPAGINEYPVIMAVAFGGSLDAAAVLINAGADPAAVGSDGFTPAEWADSQGDPEVAEYLRSVGG